MDVRPFSLLLHCPGYLTYLVEVPAGPVAVALLDVATLVTIAGDVTARTAQALVELVEPAGQAHTGSQAHKQRVRSRRRPICHGKEDNVIVR